MPIKFRCNYCRQFLGISRAQAGGIVDCPTCGRSIRVPLLDGTLQPLPAPEMDLQDAHLAKALDELARLANVAEPLPMATMEREGLDTEEDDDDNAFPQLIPEPIPIEVPIPPSPVAVHEPYREEDDLPSIPAPADPSAAPGPSAEHSLLAELASLGSPADSNQKEMSAAPKFPSRGAPRGRSVSTVAMMIGLAFVSGMLFERFVKVLESARASAKPGSAKESDAAADEPSKQVTGRITYKSADGSSQPDRGARIIALPQQREGEARLSSSGFRPSDGIPDTKVAAAAVRALGGGVATADDAGQYQLEIPAGNYQLLILSHYQSRSDKVPIDPAVLKLLSVFFEKPEELLGRVKFEFGPLKVKGTGDVRDHSF